MFVPLCKKIHVWYVCYQTKKRIRAIALYGSILTIQCEMGHIPTTSYGFVLFLLYFSRGSYQYLEMFLVYVCCWCLVSILTCRYEGYKQELCLVFIANFPVIDMTNKWMKIEPYLCRLLEGELTLRRELTDRFVRSNIEEKIHCVACEKSCGWETTSSQ